MNENYLPEAVADILIEETLGASEEQLREMGQEEYGTYEAFEEKVDKMKFMIEEMKTELGND